MNFNKFINDIKNNNLNVYGVEIYKKGKLINSYGDTKDNIYDIYSATKTILSLAVGIAYDKGLFDLDRSILEYLTHNEINMITKSQKDKFQNITIHRLLTMSVADFPFRPEGDSYLKFSLNCEINNPDKIRFNYSNVSAYLVGVALTNAIGEDLGVFIENNIFKPLYITKYKYERCPDGFFYGASKMKLTVNELSKIGLLLYNKGVYKNLRIISEKYIEKATIVQQNNDEKKYGYFIWKYKNGFSINGKWQQRCYILPESDLIVTYLSHIVEKNDSLLLSMEKNILDL